MTTIRTLYTGAARVHARVAAHRARPPRITYDDRSGSGTVYYVVPDHDAPSGGIRAMYRHVDLLRSAGIPAVVVHRRRDFRCTWFDHDTPTRSGNDLSVGPEDLVVLPEIEGAFLATLPAGVRHVVFNQSGHLTWQREPVAVREHYRSSRDLMAVMTVSDHAADLLRFAFPTTPVARVHLSIDPGIFHAHSTKRSRRIVYLSRRGRTEAEQALNILRSRGSLDGWEVMPLDGLRPDELAAELRAATVYLTLTHQEGFGLPAAEAMACGAYVVGYHGCGGREFLRPEFSSVVESGDVLALARRLETVLDREDQHPGWCAEAGARAAAWIAHEYRPDRERSDVLTLISGLAHPSPNGLSRSGEVAQSRSLPLPADQRA